MSHRSVLIFMLWLTLLTGAGVHVFSQKQNHFSGDSTKLMGELNSIFFNLPDNEKKQLAPYLEEFIQKWNQEMFRPWQKEMIYPVLNEMVRKKIRPYPDFFNYIQALNTFLNSHQPEASFKPWSAILTVLLDGKNMRKYTAFVEASIGLFGEGLVFKSATTKWRSSSGSYTFDYDTVPFLVFTKTDLTCYANDDSLKILTTAGTYYPLTALWKGSGGSVNWLRAGLEPDKVYASLGRYEIPMRFSKFSADSVQFVHKKYFPVPVWGSYTDKVLADVTEEKASYPRFYSYDKMIGISRLFNNIDYLGGFSIEGNRIIGSGDREADATLYFKRDGHDFVVARSKTFIIRPDRINAAMASVTIYHDDDSIYHPGLQLKYIDERKELSFSKDERVTTLSPWYDTYHNLEIYCEALYWIVGQPSIQFEMMKGPSKESKAVFESGSFYSLNRYDKLTGIDEINPLNLIKGYTLKNKTQEFTLDDLTRYMNKPIEQVERTVLNLANRGFLVYNYDNKVIRVKKKLLDYVSAQTGKSDYDGIYFNSFVTGESNGVLALDSFDLKLKGVRMVTLSDSQQVHVYPKNLEVLIKKDRNFIFTGKVEAGLFDFYAKDCSFEYGKFRLNMPEIDSMLFYVRSKTFDPKSGTYPPVRVKTAVTNLSGVLLIDDPGNKSGLKEYPQYPVFTNSSHSFVYWNKGVTQQGVYRKEDFFYQVNPFTMRSMDVMVTDSIRFSGTLTSAGIFPEITEPLKVMPDNSLGFETSTDTSGMPVYGGKGKFISKINLSEGGLKGDGVLTYLNSVSKSRDFLFLPDSMKTLAKEFTMAEVTGATEFPAVKGDSVWQFWKPYHDTLLVTSTTREMAMYNNQSTFGGTLALTPALLSGDGTVKIKDAEMDSRGFKFKRRAFDALIANFRIKSYDLADLTISTKNYQTHFDFDQRRGEFKSNIGISKVEFPLNKYICSMDRFDWLIDSEEIQLSNEKSRALLPDSLGLTQLIDVGYTGSEFISVHPLQDSLKFFAASARYNLRTNVINAQDVRIIKVADAAVFPDSGKVVILRDAKMQVLNRAQVIANTTTRHHKFYNADISIGSRVNYSGRGSYDYIDRTASHQTIHFDRIRVDSVKSTVASGFVSDSAGFTLSPEFAFAGEVSLRAADKAMVFDGGFHPVTGCITSEPEWVRFSAAIDPANVRLPVKIPLRNTRGEPINLGIMFFNTELQVSPSFFRRKVSFSDTTIITAEGFIEYNVPTSEFRIAGAEKLSNLSGPGHFVSLNDHSCRMRGEGKLNLSLNAGNLFLNTFGVIDYFIIPDSTRVNMAMTLNFPFSEAGLAHMSTQMNAINLPGVKLLSTPYKTALESMVPKQEYDRLKGEIDLVGRYRKFPEDLVKTLFIADISMKWDSSTRSWVSFGNIGIANAGEVQVNRYVKGIVEFSKKRNGDEFTFYFELTEKDWFYFNYRNNILMVLASDAKFNDIIRENAQSRPEQKRIGDLAKGYIYSIAPDRKKRDFLRKFEPEESE